MCVQGGRYSSSSGGPPSGGLPQLVTDPGDSQGPGSDGADAGRKNREDKHTRQSDGGKGDQGKGRSQHPSCVSHFSPVCDAAE